MRELLPFFQRPTHYLGSEWGRVAKDPATVAVRVALAFPDLYEVGMSYLGQRILYEVVNRHPEFAAERVFAPADDAAAILKERGAPLCALESDTPLAAFDVLAFHLTHELCYTNVLYMLDLAGLPLRANERGPGHPLVIAGGGCTFNAEPLAPYLDAMVLGDGEEALPAILSAVSQAKRAGQGRATLLRELTKIPGVYVPAFFELGPDGASRPLLPGYERVEKTLVPDLDAAPFPTLQVVPFAQTVHDRLAVEIARGCTRGCRFCHAGMVYRPVRERSLPTLKTLVDEGLSCTGYEELSFLSLSTGDFSALPALFAQTIDRCRREQVAVSLPSLRAGSLSDDILAMMASIRRTGATMAPEAATQRLRDVINKGITEEDILSHAGKLFAHGWQQVKLYFMIGLPTETDEDVRAIFDLAQKVLARAPRGTKRLQVTAAISPFVPKPHTPFQWEPQISLAKIKERVAWLREMFAANRKLTLRWHEPDMSFLEGVFARGGRELAPVVLAAYRAGALFCSWVDRLDLAPWLTAFEAAGIDPETYLAARDPDRHLPWDHLSCGVAEKFLRKERERAIGGKATPDCRYGACVNCGVCNFEGRVTELSAKANCDIRPRVNRPAELKDQAAPPLEDVRVKAAHLRLWYAKTGLGKYLSQLDLTRVFERAMRRAGVKPAFSAGFHPVPLLTFGRALPVGVESQAEWVALYLREEMAPEDLVARLAPAMPEGMAALSAEVLAPGRKVPHPTDEEYHLTVTGPGAAACLDAWREFLAQASVTAFWTTKRGGRSLDVRPLVVAAEVTEPNAVHFTCRFAAEYVSPLKLVETICPALTRDAFTLVKTRVAF